MNNLIRNPAMNKIGLQLRDSLFNWLEQTNGLNIPLKKQAGRRVDNKYKGTYQNLKCIRLRQMHFNEVEEPRQLKGEKDSAAHL